MLVIEFLDLQLVVSRIIFAPSHFPFTSSDLDSTLGQGDILARPFQNFVFWNQKNQLELKSLETWDVPEFHMNEGEI